MGDSPSQPRRRLKRSMRCQTKMEPPKSYINSELCQKCAKCCLQSWIYTDCKDEAIRFSWLDTNKISVVKVKEGLWKIIFDFPCSKLEYKDGKYYCKQHKGTRPEFCKTYPMNFLEEPREILELEKKTCPALREVLPK